MEPSLKVRYSRFVSQAATGVNAAQAQLVDSDRAPVALIRRFDRPDGGGRLMYVSAATMLGADPSDPGEHAYTEIVDALRQHGSQPQTGIEELWRRIAFSILITNVDEVRRTLGLIDYCKIKAAHERDRIGSGCFERRMIVDRQVHSPAIARRACECGLARPTRPHEENDRRVSERFDEPIALRLSAKLLK